MATPSNQDPATKQDLQILKKELKDEMVHEFKVIAEQLVHDFKGAFKDRTEQHTDKLKNYGERIEVLETRAGLVAA